MQSWADSSAMPRTLSVIPYDDAPAIVIEPHERTMVPIQVLNYNDASFICCSASGRGNLIYAGRRGMYDVYYKGNACIHIHKHLLNLTRGQAAELAD
jgi:hypothetical protein